MESDTISTKQIISSGSGIQSVVLYISPVVDVDIVEFDAVVAVLNVSVGTYVLMFFFVSCWCL